MGLFTRAPARRSAAVAGIFIAAIGVAAGSSAGSVHAAPPPGFVLGGQLFSGGNCEIKVTVLPATAGFTSELQVFRADGTVFHDTNLLNYQFGATDTFNGPPAGEELVFGIVVQNTGYTYKMGPASRNPDSVFHAAVKDNGDGSFSVGFEDIYGGGDADYNDNVFKFEGCIEPIVAVDDAATTAEDAPANIGVLANDGGVGIEIDSFTQGANGSVTSGTSGHLVYTPNPNFNGTDTFTYTIEDDSGEQATANVTVTVTGVNDPPDCSAAAPSESLLWPPDHRRVNISVNGVTDVDGDPVTVAITSIRQDEPTNKLGDGDTDIDGGIGTGTASVRAERSGNGDGRVYHIGFSATDGAGGTCSGTVLVGVPHDDDGTPPVDGGPLFNSLTSTP